MAHFEVAARLETVGFCLVKISHDFRVDLVYPTFIAKCVAAGKSKFLVCQLVETHDADTSVLGHQTDISFGVFVHSLLWVHPKANSKLVLVLEPFELHFLLIPRVMLGQQKHVVYGKPE